MTAEPVPAREPELAAPTETVVEHRAKEDTGTKRLDVWQKLYFGVGALGVFYLLVERVLSWLFAPSALSDP